MTNTIVHHFIRTTPPITKVLLLLTVLVSFSAYFEFVRPQRLGYSRYYLADLQFYRMFTTFFFYAKSNFELFFNFTCLYRYSAMLEESYGRKSDYLYTLMFSFIFLLISSTIFYIPHLAVPLSNTITYIWAKKNPQGIVQILGFVSFSAFYLPFVYPLMSLVFEGHVMKEELVGIAVGHIIYYFQCVHPKHGKDYFRTPCFLHRLFKEKCDLCHVTVKNNGLKRRVGDFKKVEDQIENKENITSSTENNKNLCNLDCNESTKCDEDVECDVNTNLNENTCNSCNINKNINSEIDKTFEATGDSVCAVNIINDNNLNNTDSIDFDSERIEMLASTYQSEELDAEFDELNYDSMDEDCFYELSEEIKSNDIVNTFNCRNEDAMLHNEQTLEDISQIKNIVTNEEYTNDDFDDFEVDEDESIEEIDYEDYLIEEDNNTEFQTFEIVESDENYIEGDNSGSLSKNKISKGTNVITKDLDNSNDVLVDDIEYFEDSVDEFNESTGYDIGDCTSMKPEENFNDEEWEEESIVEDNADLENKDVSDKVRNEFDFEDSEDILEDKSHDHKEKDDIVDAKDIAVVDNSVDFLAQDLMVNDTNKFEDADSWMSD